MQLSQVRGNSFGVEAPHPLHTAYILRRLYLIYSYPLSQRSGCGISRILSFFIFKYRLHKPGSCDKILSHRKILTTGIRRKKILHARARHVAVTGGNYG